MNEAEIQKYFATRMSFDPRRKSLWAILTKFLSKKYFPHAETVLELGAGYCDFINSVAASEKHALDWSPALREHAAKDVQTYVQSCTQNFPLEPNHFDAVFCSNLFEHLTREELLLTLAEITRVLKPGGRLIVLQPNFRYCYRSYFDDFTHVQIFTDRSLADLLEFCGYIPLTVMPRFLPFSLKSRVPKFPWLMRIYLSLPFKPFAAQMLLVAEKARP